MENLNNTVLENLTSYELNNIFKKASKYRNNWEAHGPRVSEKEYEERFQELYSLILKDINIRRYI